MKKREGRRGVFVAVSPSYLNKLAITLHCSTLGNRRGKQTEKVEQVLCNPFENFEAQTHTHIHTKIHKEPVARTHINMYGGGIRKGLPLYLPLS